jgi:serine phosphatase RsbU (regulator of sigma subunit)
VRYESEVEGKIWERKYSGEAADVREEIKILRPAKYRFIIKDTGTIGRLADFAIWPNLGAAQAAPFPLPSTQSFAVKFSAGERYAVEFEFVLSDTTKFANLLKLQLPDNLVNMWKISVNGDSIPATASVRRWVGEAGKVSFLDRSPKGGKIAYKLELVCTESGEMTVYLAPGTQAPEWLPKVARRTTTLLHDPWSVVAVPPFPRALATKRAAEPEIAKAKYAAQSLRARGVDSMFVNKFAAIYAQRDSLAITRRNRITTTDSYDPQFLFAANAFLPPELHVVETTPLSGVKKSQSPTQDRLDWYLVNPVGGPVTGTVSEWMYDEAKIAFSRLPSEWFWDSTIVTMKPELKAVPAAANSSIKATALPAPPTLLPLTFDRNSEKYLNQSQRVAGLFLENTTSDTIYLVFSKQRVVEQTIAKQVSRWPKGARLTALILFILAVIGGTVGLVVYLRGKLKEKKRESEAQELAADLDKARQAQLQLLPKGPLLMAGLEVLGFHQSMQQVGGDYYDFFPLADGRVIVCVADVTGHGYKAALIMSNLQATLRALASPTRSMAEITAMLNLEMFKRTSPEDFVTLAIGVISADRSRLTLCNAGHNPVYVVRASGQIKEMLDGGIMLGVMESYPYSQTEISLYSGDMLAFYTDGIPEATMSSVNEMFGYDRLKRFLIEHHSEPISDISRELINTVSPRQGTQIEDDMAIVLVRVKG